MTSTHFLWPKPDIARAFANVYRWTSVERVESRLENMFPDGVPVLFSSGRAALLYSLQFSGLGREDRVGVFPFASHCVLDAVSRIATPGQICEDTCLNIIFQQWGYIQHRDLSSGDIEDCVDSLLVPGGKLFPGGGAFEIWSLPKVLGTTAGGVLWCRSVEDAVSLRRIRDKNTGGSFLWGLRLMGIHSALLHACWQGAEPSAGQPTRLQTGELITALDSWDKVVADRRQKLNIVRSLAPDWTSLAADRLPCVVPVLLTESCDRKALARQAGISSGMRMMERKRDKIVDLLEVLPIPIHQDVRVDQLNSIIDFLLPHIRSDT